LLRWCTLRWWCWF